MNRSHNRFQGVAVFFTVLLCMPIYSEGPCGPHAIFSTFTNQADSRDCAGDRIHGDFSHDVTWGGGSKDHKVLRGINHLKSYTAQDFQHYFAERGYMTSEIFNQCCLYMLDEFVKYAQTYSGYEDTIRSLYAELKNLSLVQKVCHMATGKYCRKLQKRIGKLYKSLDAIKKEPLINGYYNPADIVEKTFKSTFWENFAEYGTLESVYKSHMPNLVKAMSARSVIYRNSANSGFDFHPINKSYNLNSNIKQLLFRSGHEVNSFTQCYGNQLQQVIHQESLDILNHVYDLTRSSPLYDHQEALVDMTSSIVDYNHADMPDKAMQIADLCWTLLDYGQAIAEGAALGLYSAAHDIFINPIEATVSIVAGKQVLAFQLCKVLYNVAEIGATAITNFDAAQEKWNKYTEPLNHIIDAINKKEITVRDAIKGGTAFVVGYKAQGKLLGGLGKLCNTIKYKSINFIKNNQLLNPQDYLTTPEGLLFKATSKSNKIKLSGQANDGSHLKNIIDNKVSKSEALCAVAASGKGILCKGDLRAKIERYKEHIFSPEHQRDGILTLGKDKAAIMDSLHTIIVSLDQKGLLKEGANQIKAAINGVNSVEIRCFIQNGEAISVNAFLSRFNRIYGNFIDAMKV